MNIPPRLSIQKLTPIFYWDYFHNQEVELKRIKISIVLLTIFITGSGELYYFSETGLNEIDLGEILTPYINFVAY